MTNPNFCYGLQPPSPPPLPPPPQPMLRSRVRAIANRQKLQTLFKNLSRLKAERQHEDVSYNEVFVPGQQQQKSGRKWSSLDEIDRDSAFSTGDPSSPKVSIRVFDQVSSPPVFVRPLGASAAGSTSSTSSGGGRRRRRTRKSATDAATGMDEIISSSAPSPSSSSSSSSSSLITDTAAAGADLSDEEIFVLRRLTMAMLLLSSTQQQSQTSTTIAAAAAEVLARLRRLEPHPHLLGLLTPYAWKLLWAMETEQIPSSHSRLMGELMLRAGARMGEEQEIAYTLSLYRAGAEGGDDAARAAALQRWKELVQRMPTPAVWNAGVRMHALERDPDTALEIIERMIKLLGFTEHKTWIPIIMAYNHTHRGREAWSLYRRMRGWAARNKEHVTATQFDTLAMSFLDNNYPSMGLEVYKHMVFAGHNARDRQQTETYRNLSKAVRAAQQQTMDPETLNAVSLDALKTLPPAAANKYFYSGWMLNLMRMDRTDLAWFLVANVMQSNGCPPDSIHCNWVIRGFLREDNVELAEYIADQMIQERIFQITKGWKRKGLPAATSSAWAGVWQNPAASPQQLASGAEEPIRVAPATVQTFSILMQHYCRRKFMDRVAPLYHKMADCDIPANAYIMNHLLFALFRSRESARLAEVFQTIVKQVRTPPDFESFVIMWTAMWRHLTDNTHLSAPAPPPPPPPSPSPSPAPPSTPATGVDAGIRTTHTIAHANASKGFLSPRSLWDLTFQYLPRRNSESEGTMKDIWHSVIKCFFLARDLEGALLALHAGTTHWQMEVDQTITQEVAFGVLRARPWDPAVTGGRPRIDAATVVLSTENIRMLGVDIMHRRGRKRAGAGTAASSANAARRRSLLFSAEEGTLESLTSVLLREMGPTTLVRDELLRARADMGLKDVALPGLEGIV